MSFAKTIAAVAAIMALCASAEESAVGDSDWFSVDATGVEPESSAVDSSDWFFVDATEVEPETPAAGSSEWFFVDATGFLSEHETPTGDGSEWFFVDATGAEPETPAAGSSEWFFVDAVEAEPETQAVGDSEWFFVDATGFLSEPEPSTGEGSDWFFVDATEADPEPKTPSVGDSEWFFVDATEPSEPVSFMLVVKPNSTLRGSVSGGGTYEVGAKATLKAKAKKGYVFAGWFADKKCTKPLDPEGYDYRNPTVKIVMPENDTTVYAKFVTAAEVKKSFKFSSATKKLAKTAKKATAGAAFSLKLGISSASLPTVTAKGLPKGLSIDKTTGEITGKATKPGSYTATVTVTDAAGNKITQKVKITVNVPSWARGDFYGTAKPGKKGDLMAYLQFTVGKTGKVSGKVTYKGKAYSFTSTLSSCTASKATFTPKVKIGKATFKPGAVTVRKTENAGGSFVEAANKKGTFTGQKKANLVKKGKALAKLVGKSFTFTKKTKNSGLTKSGDKLKVKLANGDKVTVSGTVNGKTLAALSAPLIVSEVSALPGMTTYTLYADILDAKTKYYKTVVFTVKVPVVLKPVPKVSAEFAK